MKGAFRLVVAAAALTAALVFALPAVAAPGVTYCDGQLLPGKYQRVEVPPYAACFASGPIVIRYGLFVDEGATFVLGSDEQPPNANNGSITGGVRGWYPASVQIHHATIANGINIHGGSGPFGGPFDITWNAIEDNQISGGVLIDGYNGFWFGFIRNNVSGSVTLNNNVLYDPDGNEYVTNVIRGNLNCEGNSPAPQIGDSDGLPNRVLGAKTGQCIYV